MLDRRPQAEAPLGRPADGGPDVVAMDVGVVPDGFDAFAERARDASGCRTGPRGVVERRDQVAGRLDGLLKLVGHLLGAAALALRDLAGRRRCRAGQLGEPSRGDVGHRSDGVGGHVGHRPALAPRRLAPLVVTQRAEQRLEIDQLLQRPRNHVLPQHRHRTSPPSSSLTYVQRVRIYRTYSRYVN